jgi:hypothetical protein
MRTVNHEKTDYGLGLHLFRPRLRRAMQAPQGVGRARRRWAVGSERSPGDLEDGTPGRPDPRGVRRWAAPRGMRPKHKKKEAKTGGFKRNG